MLQGKKIVLGVTGGIAAFKSCELVSMLVKRGAQVRTVLTRHACEFVAPLSFESLSGNAVCTDDGLRAFNIEHIALAKWADALVIAPATANIMAKMAGGIADDLLSTTCLAVNAPVLIAPAMNSNMWRAAATQANLKTLLERGVRTVGPGTGYLACGDADVGRMSEPTEIAEAIDAMLEPEKTDLAGTRVLVTAGPTVERIDPVRYITNRSTGKMGYAIAEQAAKRGAEVTLVSGPTALSCPKGVTRIDAESSKDLCEAVLSRAEWADAVIQAAAPADFTPETVSDVKIKKHGESLTLTLKPTTDIAAALGQRKRPGQVLVAFAAETNDVSENARAKLVKKNADFIVANDVTQAGAGFGTDTNIVTFITPEELITLPRMSKKDVADAILDRVLEIREKR